MLATPYMRARVGRGTGAGQWEAYFTEGDRAIAVFVHCPFCDLLTSLGSAPVRPDGSLIQPVVCTGCSVTYELVLVGWCFLHVDRPSVYAGPVAQADGCGS